MQYKILKESIMRTMGAEDMSDEDRYDLGQEYDNTDDEIARCVWQQLRQENRELYVRIINNMDDQQFDALNHDVSAYVQSKVKAPDTAEQYRLDIVSDDIGNSRIGAELISFLDKFAFENDDFVLKTCP